MGREQTDLLAGGSRIHIGLRDVWLKLTSRFLFGIFGIACGGTVVAGRGSRGLDCGRTGQQHCGSVGLWGEVLIAIVDGTWGRRESVECAIGLDWIAVGMRGLGDRDVDDDDAG